MNSFDIDESEHLGGEDYIVTSNGAAMVESANRKEEEEEDKVDKDPPPELIRAVIDYLKCDDEIHELTARKKELSNQRKELEERVLSMMEEMGEEVLETSSGKLCRSISRTKGSVNEEHVRTTLSSEMDERDAQRISTLVFDKRPIKERQYLKRNRPRAKKA